jgi:Terminase large subunit, T4likevirus-type, N-terminal
MKALISMRAALEDAAIMGNAFAGHSWLAWRSLLIAANGEELTSEERAVFTELTGREREPLERVEELVCIKGRRSGGTTAAAAMLVYNACLADYSDVLGYGEKALALCLAPNTRQASVSFERTAGLIDASPMLRSMVTDRTKDTIALANNVSIEIRPASHRGLRGVTCCAVCLDEACYFYVEGSNSDGDILTALRPSLITTRGALMIASTPYAEEGEVYRLYRDHYGPKGDSGILVAKATSRQTNPMLPQLVIDRALQRDPVAARSEYLAEFRADLSGFIDRAVVERCIDQGVPSRPYDSRFQYLAFADVASGLASGGDGDRFAWSIGHRDGEQIIIDLATERKPPFDASTVTAELASCCQAYRIGEVTADRFSHGFFSSELSKHGLSYRASDRDKSRLYIDSLPQIASPGRVRFPDVPAIPEQYALLERKAGSNGHDRVDARGNRHEDLVNAVSAVVAMLSGAKSYADGWNEYMDRELLRAQGVPTVQQEIGWQFGTAPAQPQWVTLTVPPVIDGSQILGSCVRHNGDRRTVDLKPDDARALLQNPVWREANPNVTVPTGQSGAAPSGVRASDVLQAAADAAPCGDRNSEIADILIRQARKEEV